MKVVFDLLELENLDTSKIHDLRVLEVYQSKDDYDISYTKLLVKVDNINDVLIKTASGHYKRINSFKKKRDCYIALTYRLNLLPDSL